MTKPGVEKFTKVGLILGILWFVFRRFDMDSQKLLSGIANERYILLDLIVPLLKLDCGFVVFTTTLLGSLFYMYMTLHKKQSI